MEAIHYDNNGAESGAVELTADIFEVDPSAAVIHQAVVARLANKRQGTAAAKGRGEVHGTNAKPFRQKKTGNARRGDLKSNLQRGGGVSGGPIPRSYRQKLPKKQRRRALLSALSIRASENAVSGMADPDIASGKTRDMAELLAKMGMDDRRVVLVAHKPAKTLVRASRNIPRLKLVPVGGLHPFEVMWAERVVFTDSALSQLAAPNGDTE